MASILLVDDDRPASAALAKLLQSGGHRVHYVSDGKEALSAVLRKLPDAIVLDLRMPEMDGLDFLQVIRSYLRLSALPVLLLTGHWDNDVARQAKSLGVAEVFKKGEAHPHQLLDWINRHTSDTRPPERTKPNKG